MEVSSYGGTNRKGKWAVQVTAPQKINLDSETTIARDASPRDLFTFEGIAGQHASLVVVPNNLSNRPHIYVQTPNGETLYSYSNFYNGILPLEVTGTYITVVSASGSNYPTGEYTLGLNLIEEPTPVTSSSSSISGLFGELTGEVSIPGDQQFFRFTGKAGDAQAFIASTPTDPKLFAYFYVLKPGAETFYKREPITRNINTQHSRQNEQFVVLPTDGEYIIQIAPTNDYPNNAKGTWNFELKAPQQTLELDSEITVERDGSAYQVFAFEGTVGQHINIAFADATTNRIGIEVYDFVGNAIASSGFSEANETGVFTLAKSGKYYIFIISPDPTLTTGSYTLGLNKMEEPTAISLDNLPVKITADINILGDHKYYSFTAMEGNTYNFTLSPDPNLRGIFYISKPDTGYFYEHIGTLPGVHASSKGTPASGVRTLPSTGKYILDVSNLYLDTEDGKLEVTIANP